MKRTQVCLVFILLIFPCSIIYSQSYSVSSMGAKLGTVMPKLSTQNLFSIGIQTRVTPENPNWRLSPFFEYAVGDASTHQQTTHYQIFSLGASAVSLFELTYSKVSPYIGGGAGISFVHTECEDNSEPNSSIREFDLTLNAVAGLELQMRSNTIGFVEIKYVVAGETDYLGVWIGVMLSLRNKPQ